MRRRLREHRGRNVDRHDRGGDLRERERGLSSAAGNIESDWNRPLQFKKRPDSPDDEGVKIGTAPSVALRGGLVSEVVHGLDSSLERYQHPK
jgi:hypothetical protein